MNLRDQKKHLKNIVSTLKDIYKMFYYYRELPSLRGGSEPIPGFETTFHKTEKKHDAAVVIISNHLPRYDKSSADLRLLNILSIIGASTPLQVHYFYMKTTAEDLKYKKVLSGKINIHHIESDLSAFCNRIQAIDPEYIWITSLWQIAYFQFITDLVTRVRQKQNRKLQKIIMDTVDFHAKEYQRKYDATKDPRAQSLAVEFMKLETELYPMADSLVLVSENEMIDIQKEMDSVTQYDIVPNIHHIDKHFKPLSKRKNICFLGNFGNHHNVDAVDHFLDDIFPAILERLPFVEFHVLGNLSDKFNDRFERRNVKVIGRINDIKKALSHYRLFVCPMRFGAGMKGKIGLAIETGLPTVTTAIGAEGFQVTSGEHCYVSDDPVEFSERCIQLLTDDTLSNRIAVEAAKALDVEFGMQSVTQTIKDIFNVAQVN